jgi:hypothetical protein
MSNFDDGFMLDTSRCAPEYRKRIADVHRHCERSAQSRGPEKVWIASSPRASQMTALHDTAIGGKELPVTDKMIAGYIGATGTNLSIRCHDNNSVFANDIKVVITGWIELS